MPNDNELQNEEELGRNSDLLDDDESEEDHTLSEDGELRKNDELVVAYQNLIIRSIRDAYEEMPDDEAETEADRTFYERVLDTIAEEPGANKLPDVNLLRQIATKFFPADVAFYAGWYGAQNDAEAELSAEESADLDRRVLEWNTAELREIEEREEAERWLLEEAYYRYAADKLGLTEPVMPGAEYSEQRYKNVQKLGEMQDVEARRVFINDNFNADNLSSEALDEQVLAWYAETGKSLRRVEIEDEKAQYQDQEEEKTRVAEADKAPKATIEDQLREVDENAERRAEAEEARRREAAERARQKAERKAREREEAEREAREREEKLRAAQEREAAIKAERERKKQQSALTLANAEKHYAEEYPDAEMPNNRDVKEWYRMQVLRARIAYLNDIHVRDMSSALDENMKEVPDETAWLEYYVKYIKSKEAVKTELKKEEKKQELEKPAPKEEKKEAPDPNPEPKKQEQREAVDEEPEKPSFSLYDLQSEEEREAERKKAEASDFVPNAESEGELTEPSPVEIDSDVLSRGVRTGKIEPAEAEAEKSEPVEAEPEKVESVEANAEAEAEKIEAEEAEAIEAEAKKAAPSEPEAKEAKSEPEARQTKSAPARQEPDILIPIDVAPYNQALRDFQKALKNTNSFFSWDSDEFKSMMTYLDALNSVGQLDERQLGEALHSIRNKAASYLEHTQKDPKEGNVRRYSRTELAKSMIRFADDYDARVENLKKSYIDSVAVMISNKTYPNNPDLAKKARSEFRKSPVYEKTLKELTTSELDRIASGEKEPDSLIRLIAERQKKYDAQAQEPEKKVNKVQTKTL